MGQPTTSSPLLPLLLFHNSRKLTLKPHLQPSHKPKPPSICVKSFIFKPANAVTKLVLPFGKQSQESTVLMDPEYTMVPLISNSSAWTSTSTRPPETSMFPVPSSSIWSQVPWMLSVPVLSVNFSAQTTSFSDNPALVTTGPRVITLKVPSLSTKFSMLSVVRLRDVTASKVSRSPTLSVVELVLVWVRF